MNKIFKLSMFVGMFVLLTMSQSVAVSNVNNGISVDALNDAKTFGMDIYFVGTGSTASSEITASSTGVYDYVTSDNTASLIVKVNITGYTEWTDKFNASGTATSTNVPSFAVAGQLDLIIDGSVTTVGAGYASISGGFVALTGLGDHTVTFVWSNMEEDGTYKYATDSITIRLRSDNADFGDYKTLTYDLDYNVTDKAEAGKEISRTSTYWDAGWADYYRNLTLNVETNVTVEAVATNGSVTGIKLTGDIDSTGSIDDAEEDKVTSTVGHVFILDATGARLYDGSDMTITIRDNVADTTSKTFVGVYVVGDAGIFYGHAGTYYWVDHEGFKTTSNDTGSRVKFLFSFDFYSAVDGLILGELTYGGLTTATVEEEPGFSGIDAIAGLLSLGVIAFVIPRKFKK